MKVTTAPAQKTATMIASVVIMRCLYILPVSFRSLSWGRTTYNAAPESQRAPRA